MNTKHSILPRRAKNILCLLSTAIFLTTIPAAWAQSASQLMEEGVYSEETKGDLDAAMQLYQKVVAGAKADQALAAQAQYHIGVCYYKKKNYTEATAAFQALTKDYPDQKDVVALARKYLAGASTLLPAPWASGEDMRMVVKLMGGLNIGVIDFTMNAGQTTNGQKIWRMTSHTCAGGSQAVSRVEADAETFAPIHSWWRHTLLGTVDAIYYPDHADITWPSKGETNRIDFDAPALDNEEVIEWIRRLPLADGFKITQSVCATLASHVVPLALTVSGPESVTVAAGTYSCYKVAMNIGQTFWYATDANRYLVKFEAGGVVAELSSVTQRSPGEKAAYENATFGFSLTVPAGWFVFGLDQNTPNKQIVGIMDPTALSDSAMVARKLSDLTDDGKKSPRAYATVELADATKQYKDFVTHPQNWTETTVAGQPAVSTVSDYMDGTSKKIAYCVFSFNGGNAVEFIMRTSRQDFDTLRPQMDAIINSYATK